MANLGFDLDHVVVDCLDSIKGAIYDEFGVRTTDNTYRTYDLSTMDYTDDADLNKRISAYIMDRIVSNDFYRHMDPVKGAVSSIQYLKSCGHKIFFISARASHIHDETHSWLDRHLVPFDGLVHAREKGAIVKKLSLDYYVDDVLSHLEAVQACGCRPTLGLEVFDAPWNKDYNKMIFSKVYDWSDIVKSIIRYKEVVC